MDYSDFDVWEFKRNENDRWVWRRLTADGDVRLACRDAFEDVDECVQDAAATWDRRFRKRAPARNSARP